MKLVNNLPMYLAFINVLQQRTFKICIARERWGERWHSYAAAPDLSGGAPHQKKGPRPTPTEKRAPHQKGPPQHIRVFSHMYNMCVPLSHFFGKENLFVDAIKLSVVQMAVFYMYIISYCDETTIKLIGFLKSARYLNLVNARPSHIERIGLSLYSLLVDFASALLMLMNRDTMISVLYIA